MAAAAKGTMGDVMMSMAKPPAKWISLAAWKECRQLSELIEAFAGICSHVVNNPQYWLKFSCISEPFKFLGEDVVASLNTGIDNLKISFDSVSGGNPMDD